MGGETVVFIKEENQDEFVPLKHHESLTLKDLADEYCISSVLECNPDGVVAPRAVAFDSPSDVLHSGRYYIARRDAKAAANTSRNVTFKGKIEVKEYELGTPGSSTCQSMTERSPASLSGSSTHSTGDGGGNSISKTLYQDFVSTRKRSRDDEDGENADTPPGDNEEELANMIRSAGVRTRFVPFMFDVHGTGCEVLVSLNDLQNLCADAEAEKQAAERRHGDAINTIEKARRVLLQGSMGTSAH